MTSFRDTELRAYWIAARRVNALRHAGAAPDIIKDTAAELEAIVQHTTWPRLRVAAASILSLALPVEAMACVAAVAAVC